MSVTSGNANISATQWPLVIMHLPYSMSHTDGHLASCERVCCAEKILLFF